MSLLQRHHSPPPNTKHKTISFQIRILDQYLSIHNSTQYTSQMQDSGNVLNYVYCGDCFNGRPREELALMTCVNQIFPGLQSCTKISLFLLLASCLWDSVYMCFKNKRNQIILTPFIHGSSLQYTKPLFWDYISRHLSY